MSEDLIAAFLKELGALCTRYGLKPLDPVTERVAYFKPTEGEEVKPHLRHISTERNYVVVGY